MTPYRAHATRARYDMRMRATKPAWGTTRDSVKKKMARAAVKSKGYKIQTSMLCMMGGSFYVAAGV